MVRPLSIDDLRDAAARIAPYVHRTPIATSAAINDRAGATILFKCENLQKVGAFKARGATNAVFSLSDDEAAHGVATHSSGNHAAALALAARNRGINATVVMPGNAAEVKKTAVANYGAKIVYCEPTLEAREQTLARIVARTGAALVHPYDDDRVIAGQGTAALELIEQTDALDAIIAPVGGGGLISGTAVAAAALLPNARVWGAEPSAVDDACRALETGRIMPPTGQPTIADGLQAALGERTFPIIRAHVTAIATVDESDIVAAMRLIWERMKLVVEPSAAVALAAVLNHPADFAGQHVGIILSGGNVDLDNLPWLEPSDGDR